jgi:hypothetical protein
MKTYKSLLWFFLVVFLVISCQKEKSFEKGNVATSAGSLKSGTTGDCLGSLLSGIYKKDTVLNSTNYVDVQVDVSQPGSYVVSSDTVNGFYFRATGTFTTTGLDTVRLQGVGTPATAGTNIFTITYDSTQCTIAVPIIDGGSGGTSVFTLAGSPNACTGASVQGIYTEGIAANSSNTATIDVNVTSVGTYAISTTAVDGITFSASGTFAAAGAQSVTLSASGTPTAAGSFTIPISAGSSGCSFQLTVVAGTPATYTLSGAPDSCTGATVQGTYLVGTPLTTSNTATIQVNVTTGGTYSISTTAVNGITFAGSGNFSTTGAQSVVLTASGTPTVAGDNVISITAGSTSCNFKVNVTTGPANADLFPLSANSWWSYDDLSGIFVTSGDSLKRVNIDSGMILGNTYKIFQNQDNTTPIDSSFFRKNGNNYLEITSADFYSSVTFDSPVPGEINFLKEGLTANQTWSSAEFTGAVGGTSTKIQYSFTCTAANTTATINGNNFNNVYKISWKPRINSGGTGYQDDPLYSFESWYAQGIGLIYFKANDSSGGSAAINILHWQVF